MPKVGDVVVPAAGETYVADDGTVSQVLDDHIDANYEPTEEEVAEFAEWIGMKLPEDSDYLWVAREGLKTPLPKEWKPCSTNDGEVYYFNFKTGESSWDHPMDSEFRQRFESEKAKKRTTTRPAPLASPAMTKPVKSTPALAASGGSKDNKLVMHYPPSSQSTSGTPHVSLGGVGAERATFASSPGAAPRILSEAEAAMEERIRGEVQLAFEAEHAKVEEGHQATMETIRRLDRDDRAAIQAADAQRRQGLNKDEQSDRDRRLQEARDRCSDTYGPELNSLEREEDGLKTRLQKIDVESQRVSSGNSQRAAVEKDVKAAHERQLRKVLDDLAAQRQIALNAAASAFSAEKAKIDADTVAALQASEEKTAKELEDSVAALESRMEAAQRVIEVELQQVEATLHRLEEKHAKLNSSPGDAAAGSDNGSPRAAASTTVSAAQLEAITKRKDALIQRIQSEAAEEQAQLQKKSEAAVVEIEARKQQARLTASPGCSPTSRTASVSVQGSYRSPTINIAYSQQLNAVRMLCAKERQKKMTELRLERESKLERISAPVSPTSSASTSTRTDFLTIEGVKAAHAAALDERRRFYAQMEADLKAQIDKEAQEASAASTAEQKESLVKQAVEAEMELFIKESTARMTRAREEAEARRRKMLADHAAGMEAYKKKKREMEERKQLAAKEAKESFIPDELQAALDAEEARRKADHDAAVTRRLDNYAAEKKALQMEVDEEMEAYEAAERARLAKESAVSGAVQPSNTVAPATKSDAVTQKRQKMQEQLAAHQATIAEREAALHGLQEAEAALKRAAAATAASRAAAAAAAAAAVPVPIPTAAPLSSSTPPPPPPPSGRLRSAHAAAMAALETSFRSEETSLEAELRGWKLKNSALVEERSIASANARLQAPPPPPPPAVVASVALPSSLQSTPTPFARLEASPWRIPRSSALVTEEAPRRSCSVDSAVVYARSQAERTQHRQAALQAARDAWLQRRKEAEPSLQSSSMQGAAYGSEEQQQQLGLAVERLHAQLDRLTSQAERLDDNRRHRHHDPTLRMPTHGLHRSSPQRDKRTRTLSGGPRGERHANDSLLATAPPRKTAPSRESGNKTSIKWDRLLQDDF